MSNNLDLSQLATNQASPETTVNDKGGELDAALTETISVNLTSDATISAANYRRCIRVLVSTSGTAKKLTLQAIKRLVLVSNTSANDISIVLGTTTKTLAAGTQCIVYTDGTANGLEQFSGSAAAGSVPFDIALFVPGLPAANANVLAFEVVRAFTWPVSLTGSLFKAGVAATASSVFTIKQNGSTIGTLTFAAAGTTATASFTGAVTFAIGDQITIVSPTTQDATLADVGFTFLGSR